MLDWLSTLRLPTWLPGWRPQPISAVLWASVLQRYSFLSELPAGEQMRLHDLAERFLATKEFTSAAGLVVTDDMAIAIAAQACLPLLRMNGDRYRSGLRLYSDFKGIVVHPGAMLARRQMTDAAGVVHHYSEVLAGEAMDQGPVTLSWQDVAAAGDTASQGHNVVIHEFVHKIDMRSGPANGCPPLPSRLAREAWQRVMSSAFDRFREQVILAERFGAGMPWLDSYGAQSPVEFFAVAAEAYFVNRGRFVQDFADVAGLFDGFFGAPGVGKPVH